MCRGGTSTTEQERAGEQAWMSEGEHEREQMEAKAHAFMEGWYTQLQQGQQ